jgi:hypothetical protein
MPPAAAVSDRQDWNADGPGCTILAYEHMLMDVAMGLSR